MQATVVGARHSNLSSVQLRAALLCSNSVSKTKRCGAKNVEQANTSQSHILQPARMLFN